MLKKSEGEGGEGINRQNNYCVLLLSRENEGLDGVDLIGSSAREEKEDYVGDDGRGKR